MKRLKKLYASAIFSRHKLLSPGFLRSLLPSALLVFILMSAAIVAAQAIRPHVAFEAESGTLSGGAMTHSGGLASNNAYLQFENTASHTCTGPQITMHVCIDPASIPTANRVASSPRQIRETNSTPHPAHADADFAAFRTECYFSHVSKNDPIVYPGQRDAAHWHIFFGNTAANENLTNTRTQGASTCYGGTLNNTAYWAPLLIDTNSYDPATQTFDMVHPMSESLGVPMQVYYKSGYEGVLASTVTNFPPGLKMIAGGNPNVTPTGPVGHRVRFDCLNSGHAQDVYNGIYDLDSVPTNCPAGKVLQARIQFPQCGAVNPDGSPVLDSPDHRSHMAYPLGWPDLGCPSTHPRPYAEIIEHFRWSVPANGSSGLRFSSDMYDMSQPAGWTFHADWWNGWDQNTFQSILNNCYYPHHPTGSGRGLDCRLNLFAPHPNGGWWALGDPGLPQ